MPFKRKIANREPAKRSSRQATGKRQKLFEGRESKSRKARSQR